MKNSLKFQPPGVQLAVFVALAAACFLLNYFITKTFFSDIATVLLDKEMVTTPNLISRFKLAQFVGATISFIVPALAFGFLSSNKPLSYVGLKPFIDFLLIGVSVVLIFSVQPFVGWLGYVNSKVHFGSLHQTIVDAEAIYTKALHTFLKMDSVSDLMINLFIMALLPAIGEELFFRGALQKVALRVTGLPVFAILASSLVFALLHGTFFKLLPIFALGILLGTVYHFTRNLWYPIVIHFFNNATAIFATYFAGRNETLKKLADDNIHFPVFAVLISLVVTIAIVLFMKKKSDEIFPEEVVEEDDNKKILS